MNCTLLTVSSYDMMLSDDDFKTVKSILRISKSVDKIGFKSFDMMLSEDSKLRKKAFSEFLNLMAKLGFTSPVEKNI